MKARFTVDGSDALEARLEKLCESVAESVRKIVPQEKLEGVLLGGGYGRGEGGVLREEEDLPYNDVEFYVLIRGPVPLSERRYGHALHEVGETLTPQIGIEVEFKILSREKLRSSPASMFYYDLVVGHRVIIGDADLLAGCEHHRRAEDIPLHEGTRLLMNRCSGLLFSLERLELASFGSEEADFVGRNLAKAQLAFGDIVLVAHRQYHSSCRERLQRLRELRTEDSPPWLDAVRKHHSDGVEFKLHPTRSTESHEALRQRHAELSELGRKLLLWFESRRLSASFSDVRSYAMDGLNKCPETSPLRNWLVTLRRGGLSAALSPKAFRYPRERLFHALCLLLWSDERNALRVELNASANTLSEWVVAYERWWRQFN